MNYAAFKTFLATFLWKQNDTDLVANLDSLITMANAELNTRLNIQRRETTLAIAPTTQDYALPTDFRSMVSLNNNSAVDKRQFRNTTASDIYSMRVDSPDQVLPFYSVAQGASGKLLRLVAPFSVSAAGSMVLVYRANVPDFAVTDTSWVADDYLDLYTYTVLSHTAPFLREDERVQLWLQMKTDALVAADDEDKRQIAFGGSPLQMRPHHAVPR
jgi:hypothetical protein